MLNQRKLKTLLRYDRTTGDFYWRIKSSVLIEVGQKAGYYKYNKNNDYYSITINKREYRAHHLAWLYVYGYLPTHPIHHINGRNYDNRISNLEEY
jgi:hypothetical protein